MSYRIPEVFFDVGVRLWDVSVSGENMPENMIFILSWESLRLIVNFFSEAFVQNVIL